MSFSHQIQTGDPSLDEALEHEAQLKALMADMLDESDLPTVVAFLWPWLDDAALSSATWRFCRLVGLPDDDDGVGEAPPLLQLILAHAHLTDDVESYSDDIVELLVESIDGARTRQILKR